MVSVKSTLPVVVEMNEYNASVSLSVYNFPLQDFLSIMDPDIPVQDVEIFYQDEEGDFNEVQIPYLQNTSGLLNHLSQVRSPMHSIFVRFEDEFTLDSNITDELHAYISKRYNIEHLIEPLFKHQDIFPAPRIQSSFCCEIYKGSMNFFQSMNQYLKRT